MPQKKKTLTHFSSEKRGKMKHFHIQMAKLVEIFSKKNSNHPHEVWHTLKYAMHMAQCEALVYQSEQPQAGFHSKVRDCYHFGEKKWTTLHIDPWSQTAPRRRPPMMARSPPAAHESPLGMVDVTYHHRNHHRDVGGPVLSNFTLSTRLFLVAKKNKAVVPTILPWKSRVSLVGPVGSGKTTVLRLLMGLYEAAFHDTTGQGSA